MITLESFVNPSQKWSVLNDPVMGGESYATVSIEDGLGIFDGKVVDVPFLQAPGFITMRSEEEDISYPDVSSCDTLRLVLHNSEDTYKGYRVSFGNVSVPGNRFARGYKADFTVPSNGGGAVDIPFHDFTARWDDATGDAIVSCAENQEYCPDVGTLQNMETISLWGEGVAGKVHLEVESIAAIGCLDDGMDMDMSTITSHSGNNGGLMMVLSDAGSLVVASAVMFTVGFSFIAAKTMISSWNNKNSGEYKDVAIEM